MAFSQVLTISDDAIRTRAIRHLGASGMHPPSFALRLLLACGLCALLLPGRAQDPMHRRFTLADGLPSNTVYWAMQDHDGYMWFGTDLGACRFDGRTFTTFDQEDGLEDNEVLEIHQDSHGRIWFLGFNGRLCYFADGRVHNSRNTPWLGSFRLLNSPFSFAEAPNGDLWFGCSSSAPLVVHADGHAEQTVLDTVPRNGALCSVAWNGSAVVMNVRGRALQWMPAQHVWRAVGSTGAIGAVMNASDAHQQAWVRTPDGLAVVDPNGTFRPMVRDERIPAMQSIRVQTTVNGGLWVSELHDGVLFISAPGPAGATATHLFQKEHVTCAITDAADDLWLTTLSKGVILVPQRQLRTARYPGALDPDQEEFRAVLVAHDGSVWAGSGSGILYHWHREGIDTIDLRTHRSIAERINGIVEDAQGRIWVAGDQVVGMVRPAVGSARPRTLLTLPVMGKSIAFASTDTALVAAFGVRGLTVRSGRISYYGIWNEAQLKTRTYCVLSDAAGGYWFEQVDTLCLFQGGALQHYDQWTGPHYGRINGLGLLGADTIVVATTNGGLGLLHRGQRVAVFDHQHGLASDACHALCIHQGVIYVVTNAGLSIIDPQTGQVRNTQALSGMNPARVKGLAVDDRFLYLASGEGLLRVPRDGVEAPEGPASIRFTAIQVNGADRSANAPLHLRHGRDRLVVEATLLSYTLGDVPEYQFRTHGDGPWTDSPIGRLELPALEPGEYDLQIRGRIPGRPWSDALRLAVQVTPPFWRSGPAKALFAVAAFLLVFFGLRWWNLRRWRVRAAALRQREALNQERQRIAMDVHDDLGADLSNLLLLSRLAAQEQHGRSATLQRMENLAAGMMQRIDEIIWSLDPRQDTLGATVAFLDRYASDLARAHDLVFRSHVLDTEDPTPLPAPYRRGLYLILKELLNNVAKHARARQLHFHAVVEQGELRITLEDDGVGLPADQEQRTRTGNGLANMQRRAAHLGGRVELRPRAGGGTVAEIRSPLHTPPPNG